MFGELMQHFGPTIQAIQGNWTYGDNLEIVNKLTQGGMSLAAAALNGPTGRYASSWGFTNVSVLNAVKGTSGSHSKVHVLFTR